MTYQLKPEIKKLFCEEASVFSFPDQSNSLQKDSQFFEQWLAKNSHAQMQFLEKNSEPRKNPQAILEGAQSAILFLFPYSYGNKIRPRLRNIALGSRFRGNDNAGGGNDNSLIGKKLISKYVYGKDYHKVLKKKLEHYAKQLQQHLELNFSYRPIVDSVPFFERAHAREAGLGFIGKNTMLIRPGLGSYFFIATLLTTLPIEKLALKSLKKNSIQQLDCGSCTKCLEACPTGALENNYSLNANKCLSYLSIEHRDIVKEEFIPHFKNTLYGCDICQDVCPYNFVTLDHKMAPEFSKMHMPFTLISAEQLACMTREQYVEWFSGTAATRAKYEGLVRNALYHLYASKHVDIKKICEIALNKDSDLIKKTAKQLLNLMGR